jgi:hypothetical protein
MIKPDKIVDQIQQGELPATWRVFRGKGQPVASAILAGIIIGIFVDIFGSFCAIFGIATGVLSSFYSPTSVSGSGFPSPDGGSSSPTLYPTQYTSS